MTTHTNPTSSRDPLVDVLKGLAILLVLWGHFIQHTLEPQGMDFVSNPVFLLIYMFHMPLFIFLSGYVMAFNLQRRAGLSLIGPRFRSLIVPFFVWSIAAALATYVLETTGDRSLHLAGFLLHSLDFIVLHPRIWFLVTLFLLSVVLVLAVHFSGRFILTGLVTAYAVLLFLPLRQYCAIYYVQWFFPFFAAGYLASKHQVMTRKFRGREVVVVAALGLFIVLATFWTKTDYIYVNQFGFTTGGGWTNGLRLAYRYAAGFTGITVIWACGLALRGTRLQNEFARLGSYALDIYVLQIGLLEGAYSLLVRKAWLFSAPGSTALLMAFAPVAAIGLAYACMGLSALLLRRHPLLLALLVGGRTGGAAESIAPFPATRA